MIAKQSIHRMGELRDISNAADFFLSPNSDFVTGQTLYLGGV
jgi:3-oxoacyl-[acyl-carrier protein] reductase